MDEFLNKLGIIIGILLLLSILVWIGWNMIYLLCNHRNIRTKANNSKKPFKFGIVIGRFQIPHMGHLNMIKKGMKLCETFVIYIGSSQEFETPKNPFSYIERHKTLKEILGGDVEIRPLPDIGVGNNEKWGKYVLETCQRDFGIKPDLIISGNEKDRVSWFKFEDMEETSELILNKGLYDISTTKLKEYLVNNDIDNFRKWTTYEISSRFDDIRERYLKILEKNKNEK